MVESSYPYIASGNKNYQNPLKGTHVSKVKTVNNLWPSNNIPELIIPPGGGGGEGKRREEGAGREGGRETERDGGRGTRRKEGRKEAYKYKRLTVSTIYNLKTVPVHPKEAASLTMVKQCNGLWRCHHKLYLRKMGK